MHINYVENKNGKLFSFFRHDFKTNTDDEGNFICIDGGHDYQRYSGELKQDEIENLIEQIRNQFIWGVNFTKDGKKLPKTEYKLLKDLDTDHVINILSYFNNRAYNSAKDDKINNSKIYIDKSWFVIHDIFTQELKYRYINKIY